MKRPTVVAESCRSRHFRKGSGRNLVALIPQPFDLAKVCKWCESEGGREAFAAFEKKLKDL